MHLVDALARVQLLVYHCLVYHCLMYHCLGPVMPNRTVFVDERSGRASCVNVMRECAESIALFLYASTQRTFTSPGPWPLNLRFRLPPRGGWHNAAAPPTNHAVALGLGSPR